MTAIPSSPARLPQCTRTLTGLFMAWSGIQCAWAILAFWPSSTPPTHPNIWVSREQQAIRQHPLFEHARIRIPHRLRLQTPTVSWQPPTWLHPAPTLWDPNIQSVFVYGREAMIWMAWRVLHILLWSPLIGGLWGIFWVDGRVRRRLRCLRGARESAAYYHRSQRRWRTALIVWLTVLGWPTLDAVAYGVIAGAVILGILLSQRICWFQKYA